MFITNQKMWCVKAVMALLPAMLGAQVRPDALSGPSSVQSVSPPIGTALGGATATIKGAQLYKPQQVLFGNEAATVVSSGTTFIDVITPAHAVGPVNITVVNSAGFQTVLKNGYTYTIAITTGSLLPDGIAQIAYSQPLSATGGIQPYSWSVSGGALPQGITLNSATGVISGLAAPRYGKFNFTVTASDSSSPAFTASASFSITIDIGLSPNPVPASFFGVSAILPSDWPGLHFGAFGKGGETTWAWLEPAQGTFNWAPLDAYLANAEAHGMTMFWTNHGVPQWAAADTSTCSSVAVEVVECTSTVSNLSYVDEFMTAMVARYKGKILLYELWNEPDTEAFTGSMQDIVGLTQHMYNAIRAGDPAALIASPSATNATWLGNYFAAGGPAGVDVVAIHGYLTYKVDQPENLAAYKVLPWHPVMTQYGLAQKPIWDTESSWDWDSVAGFGSNEQAAFVARDYLLHWSAGVTEFYWYAWDSPIIGTLWNSGTNPTPNEAGTAYSQVYKWMAGATMPQPCSTQGAVYTCTLTRPGGYTALAVWDASKTCTAGGGCTTSNFTAPSGFVQYRDLTGKVTTIQPGQVVLIGARPILLEN